MRIYSWLRATKQHLAIIASVVFALLVFGLTFSLGIGDRSAGAARALDIATATATSSSATATSVPTNTPKATDYPIVQGGGLAPFLKCGAYGATVTPGDCVQVENGSSIHVYNAAGSDTFHVIGSSGDVHASGALDVNSLVLATPLAYGYQTAATPAVLGGATPAGVRVVCGELSVTGSATVPAALFPATPQVVTASMNADANGDHSRVTSTNSGGVVTLKVWNTALTPAAAQTAVPVDWCISGVP